MCFAVSTRQSGKSALTIGSCAFDVYLDGDSRHRRRTRDLDKMQVNEYAGIEIYKGAGDDPARIQHDGIIVRSRTDVDERKALGTRQLTLTLPS